MEQNNAVQISIDEVKKDVLIAIGDQIKTITNNNNGATVQLKKCFSN